MQSYNGGGEGRPMNSTQLQEEMQRLQEMQARLRQQQQSLQAVQGNSMMQQPQQQRWVGQQMGNQQQGGGQRNSFTGGISNTALFLMQQEQQQQAQQQRSRSSSQLPGGMSNPNSAQSSLYWNAMQAVNTPAGHGSRNSQSSVGGGNQNPVSAANNRGSPSGNSMQALLMQQQQMGSSTSSVFGGTQPQLAGGQTAEQLLMQQQRIMADLKRQLQSQQTSGAAMGGLQRRSSSSSLPGTQQQQRQVMFQMQQRQESGLSNSSHGGVGHDRSALPLPPQNSQPSHVAGMPPQDRRSSIVNVEPISLASLMGGQPQLSRRESVGSHASAGSGNLYAGSPRGGGGNVISPQQAQMLQQQLMSELFSTNVQQQSQQAPVQQVVGSSLPMPRGNITREGSVDTVKRDNRTAPNNPARPQVAGSETGQMFMDGSFEGGWQSNADLPERREVIFSIVKLIEQMRPADKTSEKLPQMAKRLEEHLYRSAQTKEEYLDSRTLKRRLQNVAHGLEMNRPAPGGLQATSDTSQSIPVQDDTGLSDAERRTKTLRQQLQQMQQLQKLQKQGTTADYLSQQANLLQMQQAGLASASQMSMGEQRGSVLANMPHSVPSGQAHGNAASSVDHPSILKTNTKYQDPASAQKRKVVKQQQQRLMLLRHASKCKKGAACKTKFCGQMVALWKHMKKCRDKNCKTSHCLSSRCVLNHYRMCKSENRTSTCEVCGPVMQHIKTQQMSQADRDVTLKDEFQPNPSADMSPVAAFPDRISPEKQWQIDELEATQRNPQQQQMLLKQLQQQQAHLMEQQKQLRRQQQQVQPQTQQGMQLQQQQGLLQQLQHLYSQQQVLLQRDVSREPQSFQGGQIDETISPESMTEFPESTSQESGSRKSPQQQLSPSPEVRKSRGRGGKGKRLKAMEPVPSELSSTGGSRDLSSAVRKRSADSHAAAPELDSTDEEPSPTKKARPENSDSLPKVLQQGNPGHTTSLVQSMSVEAVESHLASLNDRLHITPQTTTVRCLPIIRKLIDDQFGWVFRDAVDPVALELPDYFDVIKNPMHLSGVEEKLRRHEYYNLESFASDTRLVFENAILYNGEDSEVGEMAAIMLRYFEKDLKAVLKDVDRDQRALRGGDSCILCGSQRRLFEPVVLHCDGACGMERIRRNATYYSDQTKLNHWCASCFANLNENELIMLEDGSEVPKSTLQKFKNDGLPEEAWVQCDECNGWVHQICALFNGRKNKNAAAYRCPKCHIVRCRQGVMSETDKCVKAAKDLPHCKMSQAIELGLRKALVSAYEDRATELGVDISEVEKAEDLFVRVVSNMEKKHLVRDEMHKRYAKDGCASEFPVRSKCIALFQTIDGVDVILFAMYVYEYDDSCPAPNRRRVYISYLDSIYYFQPKCYRTIAYHALIIEYLRYVKERGFHTAHIWSCPPSGGDDYVFYCHPKEQLVPREDMLLHWYQRMLEKAKEEGIVLETLTLYDEYFKSKGKDTPSDSIAKPTCLPYFEGDYIPGEIENIINEYGGVDNSESNVDDNAEASQDEVMRRLGDALYNMRQNFIVVRLRSKDFVAAVESGEDVSRWIDECDGDSSGKRIKIGRKDSNCLSQLPPDKQKFLTNLVERTGEAAGDMNSNTPGDLRVHENVAPGSISTIADQAADSKKEVTVSDVFSGGKDPKKPTPMKQTQEKPDGALEQATLTDCASTSDGNESKDIVTGSMLPKETTENDDYKNESTKENGVHSTEYHPQESSDKPVNQMKVDESDKHSKAAVVSKETAKVNESDHETTQDVTQDQEQPRTDSNGSVAPVSNSTDTTSSFANEIGGSSEATNAVTPAPLAKVDDASPAGTASDSEQLAVEEDSVLPPSKSRSEQEATKASLSTHVKGKRSIDEIGPTLSRHFASARSNAKPVGSTKDEDDPQEIEMFESRQQFLNYCQANHFQFDELRRAKHSTMMVLFQLHNPSAPMILQQCGACYRDITHGTRYHCKDCSNFDLCQDCYEPVTTGLWAKRDSRFTHNKRHKFVAIDMEASADSQKSPDERAKTMKMHLELLSHAATCDGPPTCGLNNCQRMKKLFEHVETCDVTFRNGCKICTRLLSLLTIHARTCTVRGSCPLPFCDRIRERNKRRKQQQQLMDDRRREAQNELYRR